MIRWRQPPSFLAAWQITASFTNCGRAPTIEQIRILSVERPDRFAYVLDVLGRQLRVDRQRQGFGRQFLAHREVARLVTQRGEALLLVQRERIIDLRPDS